MWAAPKSCAQDRVLLCAHGGGYVLGSMYTHRKVYAHVAKAIGCRALIVHYGRAPENVHPGPVNDMVRANAQVSRARCIGLQRTSAKAFLASTGRICSASRRPLSVKGMSVVPVCWPLRLQAVSPCRAIYTVGRLLFIF